MEVRDGKSLERAENSNQEKPNGPRADLHWVETSPWRSTRLQFIFRSDNSEPKLPFLHSHKRSLISQNCPRKSYGKKQNQKPRGGLCLQSWGCGSQKPSLPMDKGREAPRAAYRRWKMRRAGCWAEAVGEGMPEAGPSSQRVSMWAFTVEFFQVFKYSRKLFYNTTLGGKKSEK